MRKERKKNQNVNIRRQEGHVFPEGFLLTIRGVREGGHKRIGFERDAKGRHLFFRKEGNLGGLLLKLAKADRPLRSLGPGRPVLVRARTEHIATRRKGEKQRAGKRGVCLWRPSELTRGRYGKHTPTGIGPKEVRQQGPRGAQPNLHQGAVISCSPGLKKEKKSQNIKNRQRVGRKGVRPTEKR